MLDDPYFIRKRGFATSTKRVKINPANESYRVNWAAPYLDGCENCAFKNDNREICALGSVLDRLDVINGTYYRCEEFEYMGVWLQRQARELINEFITTNDNRYKEKHCKTCDTNKTCMMGHTEISNCQQLDILEEIQHGCETCNIQDCREC
jgi:hypothetical protein